MRYQDSGCYPGRCKQILWTNRPGKNNACNLTCRSACNYKVECMITERYSDRQSLENSNKNGEKISDMQNTPNSAL